MATPQTHHNDIKSQRQRMKACNVQAEIPGCVGAPQIYWNLMATMLYTVTKDFYETVPFCVFKPFPQGFPKEPFPTAIELLPFLQRRKTMDLEVVGISNHLFSLETLPH